MSGGAVDTTPLLLSQALYQCLQGCNILDSATKRSLLQTKDIIDTAIAFSDNALLEDDSSKDRSDVEKSSKPVAKTAAITASSQEQRKAGKKGSIQGLARLSTSVGHSLSMFRQSEGRRNSTKTNQRRQKARVLLAVKPFTALTVNDSNESILQRLVGQSIALLFWRFRKLLSACVWLGTFAFWALMSLVIMLPSVDEMFLSISSIFCFIAVLLMVIHFMSLMNYKLYIMSLWYLETQFFLAEALFFAISLWGVLCFQWYSFLFALSWLLVNSFFLLYDVFPVGVRERLRYAYAIYVFAHIALLLMLYSQASPRTCYYRIHPLYGFVPDEAYTKNVFSYPSTSGNSDGSTTTSETAASSSTLSNACTTTIKSYEPLRWSVSLTDFCLNRGFTVGLLILKIIITAFKHPQDCVIIKSRIRLIENVQRVNPGGATARNLITVTPSLATGKQDFVATGAASAPGRLPMTAGSSPAASAVATSTIEARKRGFGAAAIAPEMASAAPEATHLADKT